MISYKYKLYRTKKTKHLDKMLREACYVWNHALALQKRYYKLYHKYIPRFTCGAVHPRDLFAAENILRQGIAELGSGSKPSEQSQGCSHVSHPTIPCK